MNDNTKIIAALLAGLAAGAALGILFAPEKGSETRDKLNDALKNLGDAIKDRAAEEIDNLSNFKEDVVDKIKTKFNKEQGFDPSVQNQAPVSEQL
jgi:gas vesicle protein